MFTRLIGIAALGVSAFSVSGCVNIYPTTYGLDANDALLVRQTCTDVMGLRAGAEFEACAGSLADSVLALQEAHVLAEADRYCTDQGLMRGTPELAKCAVMFRWEATQNGASASPDRMTASTTPPSTPLASTMSPTFAESLPKKYYFHMSQSEQVQRAELSCAHLGLHPAWGSFRQCVANLQFSIIDLRYTTPH